MINNNILAHTHIHTTQSHMDVNYYGPIRVTKAALPLLKRYGRGGSAAARIININSTSGLLPGLPLKGGKTSVPGRSMGVMLQTPS